MVFGTARSPRQLLSRFFATTGGGLVVIAGLALFVSDHLVESFARADGEQRNKVMTRAVSNALEGDLLRWLDRADMSETASVRAAPAFQRLDDGIQRMKQDLPILKVELYRLDGVAVYSTGPEDLGERVDPESSAFWRAARGTPYSQVERGEDFMALDGAVFHRDAVASYLPLRHDGEIVGVFEIYSDYDHIVATANRYFPRIAVLVLIACMVLYGIVLLFVWRAQEALSEARDDLVDAREQAEAANHAKSRFLANMSHELRTPLNAILGFSEIMQKESFGPIGDARYKAYASDIHISGTHLRSLIDDVLDMSKIEAGSMDVEVMTFDLRDLLDDVGRIMGARVEDGGKTFHMRMPEGRIDLESDPRLLRQIILNLLSNAIKFTPEGGDIDVGVELEADKVHIRVRDTGIGMSDAELERATQPFGQVHRSNPTGTAGTGLGLPICRSLVDLLGGGMDIRTAPSAGTTVSVSLPRSAAPCGADAQDLDTVSRAAGRAG